VEAYLRASGIFRSNYIRPQISKERRKYGRTKWREIPFSKIGMDKDGEKHDTP
jgi:hypothetical protein